MQEYPVQAFSLTKRYNGEKTAPALNEISCNIAENTITGFIGRNGSGKTTLMKLLCGTLKPTSGELRVFGEKPWNNYPILQKIIYTTHAEPHEGTVKIQALLERFAQFFPQFDIEFAKRLLQYFDLSARARYGALSQGMKAALNFSLALATRSPLTLLDEPMLGMDVTVRKAAYEILVHDFTEVPRTILISSHLIAELEGVLSDILLIEDGRVLANMPIDDFRAGAFRADGTSEQLAVFGSGLQCLEQKDSPLQSYAIYQGSLTAEHIKRAESMDITLSSVTAEELCILLTKQNKEELLKCLW